ncbi:hypothetical protein C8R43DRAFT_863894, partial [Mycena crocata]
ELVDALREAEERDGKRKEAMIEMQAGTILVGMYANRAQAHIQATEHKKAKKGRAKMGDGKAKYLTGDTFFQLCQDHEKDKAKAVADKDQRQADRETRASELASRQAKNERIRERNGERKKRYQA